MVKGMNRIVFWFLSTVTVVVLMFGYHTSTEGPEAAAAPAALAPATTSGSSDATSGGASDEASSGSSDATAGGSSDTTSGGSDASDESGDSTTVTGDAEDTQWGQVQVEITISGGKITDVSVPVYPNNNGRDQQINSYALPQLIQETVDAQSADIDMISGATVTSDGYVRSLQSALDKAGL